MKQITLTMGKTKAEFCSAGKLIINPWEPCPHCGASMDEFCRGHEIEDEPTLTSAYQDSERG